MATNETTSGGGSGGAMQGAMLTMMALGLMVQVATLGVLIWFVAGNGQRQEAPRPMAEAKDAKQEPATPATNGSLQIPGTPNVANSDAWHLGKPLGPITLVRNLPSMIPDADREYTWYSSGDELFALESTMTANFGGLTGAATFRVPGRGSVEVGEGEQLYSGSSVKVLKVTENIVVVSNGVSERDLSVPRPAGSSVRTSMGPDVNPIAAPGDTVAASVDVPDGSSLIRPMDPRLEAIAEAFRKKMEGESTNPPPAERDATPSTAMPPSDTRPDAPSGDRRVSESYPAADWENFQRELRDSMKRSVMLKDMFDANYRPSGVEVAKFLDTDAILFNFLRIEAGDIIIGIGGQRVSSKADLEARLKTGKFEKEITFQVERGDEIVDVVVKKFPQ